MSSFAPQPAISPPGVWSFPPPQRSRLDNGLDVWVYDLPGQHVVAAHLVLDVPLDAESPELEGVATLCARTLDEGTARHPGESFAEALETEGAGFGIDVTLSGTQAVLDVPVTRFERALELFAEAVTEPAQSDEDVNRHRQLRLAEIEQARANSSQLASTQFRRAVFAPDSRASRMSGGEPETVAAVMPAAVRDFHRGLFGPAGATLVLAGAFPTDPVALAQRVLGGWSNPEQRRVDQQPAGRALRRAQLIDRPGSVQADLRLGGFGIDRHDPRWADITVSSYAVGGGFLSRLNRVLREERGYTYGVRMVFGPLRSGGSYAVQGSFRTEVLAAAVAEARELMDVSGQPLTEVEVDDAVNYFVGVSPLRYATANGVADQGASQVLGALGEDYVNRNLADLRSVTPESATSVYTSLVDLDNLTLVVVGDAETLAEPLRAAGFDDLEILAAG